MSEIGPGTMLVCVDTSSHGATLDVPFVVGNVYECGGSIVEKGCPCGGDVAYIKGYNDAHPFGRWWCLNRFVPAGKKGQFNFLLTAIKISIERIKEKELS